MAFEFPPNARTMGEVWNINTGLWLRYSVYERLIGLNGGKATGLITMATFVTSAVWHGFHPVIENEEEENLFIEDDRLGSYLL